MKIHSYLEQATTANGLRSMVSFARNQGARTIGLCIPGGSRRFLNLLLKLTNLSIDFVVDVDGHRESFAGFRTICKSELSQCGLDSIIVWGTSMECFGSCLRKLDGFIPANVLVLPATPSILRLQNREGLQLALEYVQRSGLQGHYAEFGVFWGNSFFSAYHCFANVLKGNFYAFDSFEGLSSPDSLETLYTSGDFRQHSYSFNKKSFRAVGELLGIPFDRIRIVQGYYQDTLKADSANNYHLKSQSISICAIDCDLYESTKIALDFVSPFIESGGLIYFDDWRLCRASPIVGERAAALSWLRENPSFELIELFKNHWQHQWFVFQRK